MDMEIFEIESVSVAAWSPGDVTAGDAVTQVHMILNVPAIGLPLVLRLKSKAAVDDLIAGLTEARDQVFADAPVWIEVDPDDVQLGDVITMTGGIEVMVTMVESQRITFSPKPKGMSTRYIARAYLASHYIGRIKRQVGGKR